MIVRVARGTISRRLIEQPFWEMVDDFSSWRIDSVLRMMEARKAKGRILPFVRGLYLSSRLIYAVREYLSGSGLTASWGHLLDRNGEFCSSECDVIIHREGFLRQWNGSKEPVMDFRFIEQARAVAVISCKSYLTTRDIERDYCKSLKPFVNKIWLFAECCNPRSVEGIRRKAKECGYSQFWFLYNWSKQTNPKPNNEGWITFVDAVKRLPR